MTRLIWTITSSLLLFSCVTPKKIIYFQNENKVEAITASKAYLPKIQAGDILSVTVNSISPEASKFFNQSKEEVIPIEYLVDANGNIEMPVIGEVKVAGNTTSEIKDLLKNKLDKYLEQPTVNVNFSNFKITVLGEVNKPGVYNISNEQIDLIEAIGLAGDLTIYGKRKEVLVVRENQGKKEFIEIDITNREVFGLQNIELHPNDIIYIAPSRAKIAAGDNFYRVAPLVISVITLLSIVLIRINP